MKPLSAWLTNLIPKRVVSKAIISSEEMRWSYVQNVEMIMGILKSTGVPFHLKEPADSYVNRPVIFVCHVSKDVYVNIEFEYGLLAGHLEREWVVQTVERGIALT